MIYFIQAENGHIKIGFTDADDAMIRLASLQTGSPVLLKLLATIPGTIEEEKDLHRRFGAHRLHGEWFKPVAEILDIIPAKEALSCDGGEVVEKSVAIRVLTVGRKQFTKALFNQLPEDDCIDWDEICDEVKAELGPRPYSPFGGSKSKDEQNWIDAGNSLSASWDIQKYVKGDVWGWVTIDCKPPNDVARAIIFVRDGMLFKQFDRKPSGFPALYRRRFTLPGWGNKDQLFFGI